MKIIRRENVNIQETVRKTLPKVLIKDLQDNERICPVCHGLGVKVVNNVYGIRDDTSEAGKREHFPYKCQSLTLCSSCYYGVQKLCEYCGEPYKQRGYYHCDCDGFKRAEEEKHEDKWKETLANAKEVKEPDVTTMLYCEEYDRYYSDIEDFFKKYEEYANEEIYTKPVRLWICSQINLAIDAGSVIESACDSLHEDASENCDYKSLQELLDKWCDEQSGTTTFYPCYEEYVTIDWSKYIDET